MAKYLFILTFFLSTFDGFYFELCNSCSSVCPSEQLFINSTGDSFLTCAKPTIFCPISKYRTIDGSCNNLVYTNWGMAQNPYSRMVPNNYADGLDSLPNSVTGKPLLSARDVRVRIFEDYKVDDPDNTLLTMQWGQLIAHDMSLTTKSLPKANLPNLCCDNGQYTAEEFTNPLCAAIPVSPNDPVRGPSGTKCLEFERTRTTMINNCTCPDVPAEPLTATTAYMDLSVVYGSNETQGAPLRAWCGGKLLTVERNGEDWPPSDFEPPITCDMKTADSPCYLGGDFRINQSPHLAILQVIMLREHNRIADALSKLNPHWSDEIIFQESRRILIAINQHINYYEFLPILLGYENMVKHKLIYPDPKQYINDYDPTVTPAIFNEHATAAYRVFHSSVQGMLKKYQQNRQEAGSIQISDWFDDPAVIEQDDNFLELSLGFTIQPQSASDPYFDTAITEFFAKGNKDLGADLRATDIQRGRDHGLGSYVKTRAALGLSVPKVFDDLLELIPKEFVKKLKEIYPSIEDVELVVAGALETKVNGALAGPTYLKIMTKQFYHTRVGDRYFYENGSDKKIAFTSEQLESIRYGSWMARLVCDNVKGIQTMQFFAFKKISIINPVIRCEDIPTVNLNLWKE